MDELPCSWMKLISDCFIVWNSWIHFIYGYTHITSHYVIVYEYIQSIFSIQKPNTQRRSASENSKSELNWKLIITKRHFLQSSCEGKQSFNKVKSNHKHRTEAKNQRKWTSFTSDCSLKRHINNGTSQPFHVYYRAAFWPQHPWEPEVCEIYSLLRITISLTLLAHGIGRQALLLSYSIVVSKEPQARS